VLVENIYNKVII